LKLELRGVCKRFSTKSGELPALESIDLNIRSGEFVSLLGPSGCGKTTLLNVIAGLEKPTAGEVRIDGRAVVGPGKDRVMIFQDGALFPWMNVLGNVEFGLRMSGVAKAERQEIARRFLSLVHLSDFERAYVHELSGGMKQRVALARALALDPDVLLMDEPFGALDAQTRDMLHEELQNIWADTCKTVLFVTHNVREAIVLGDRVVVLSARPARIRQEFVIDLPRPRQIENYAVVDLSSAILAVMRDDVLISEREREKTVLARIDLQVERGMRWNPREVGDDCL
jgi:NitT/TauT family transport system ATP-binding protein